MEIQSAGPVTRSRAKSGAAMPTPVAPSTRKKPATRSTRKSTAASGKQLPVAEPDDTATRSDVAEHTHDEQQSSSSNADSDIPTTAVAADDVAHNKSIAGLTPINTAMTPGYPAPTPGTIGASPVMPINLESMWSPDLVPTREESRPSSAADPSPAARSTPSDAGVDLAAMFISTPPPSAVAADSASPVEGLVSAAVAHQAPASPQQPFAEQPFGGFADATAPEAEAAAGQDSEQAAEEDMVGFGSPAAVAAVEDGSVTELEDDAPVIPVSSKPSGSPAPAAAVTPGRSTTPRRSSRLVRTPVASPAAAASPMLSPGWDDDDDMPPAEAEYSDEAALYEEGLAAGMISPPPPAAVNSSMVADSGQLQDAAAEQDTVEIYAAADVDVAGLAPEQYSDEGIMSTTEDYEEGLAATEDDDMSSETAQLEQLEAEVAAEAAVTETTAAADLQETDEYVDEEDAAEEPAEQQAVDQVVAGCDDAVAEAEDTAMDSCDSPVLAAAYDASSPAAVAPAAVDLAAMSPELSGHHLVTSPNRQAGATTTTAPPKSALAKPKDAVGGSSVARKSAHVVVPGPSPKSSAKTAGGSGGSRHSMGEADDGSSPGHTPYPSKAKVKAATAAADRSSMAAAAAKAAAASTISHKKDVSYARAHSALKQYANKSAGEQQTTAADTGSSGGKKPASPSVGSRLLQPTASFMAKARATAAPEADPLVWAPPPAEADSVKPRLKSQVVVPSPPAPKPAVPESLRGLRKVIKQVSAKAEATVAEQRSSDDKVRDVHEMRGSKTTASKSQKPAAVEHDLDFDGEEDEYEDYEETYDQDADALADSLAGMAVGQLRISKPAGPLKGVVAPAGRHMVFDDEGKAKETPASKLRQAPRHTYFDDEGRPIPAPAPARPVWR